MQLNHLPNQKLQCGKLILDCSQPQIMGILNVTPDSFSDGGLYHQKEQAVERALTMIAEGASIIDIGGESTRPNADKVAVEEELQRVIPVVEELSKYNVLISIDTSQPEVIRQAVQAGANIWNDVRALTRPNALQTAAELDIPVILMHMRGEPDTMNQFTHYQHVTQEVKMELLQRIEQALAVGVKREHIIIDPGFGFAKNTQQNLQLLNELYQLYDMGFPILSALSRKRFVGAVLNEDVASERVMGSVVAHLLSIQQGASIVRVHDVKATKQAIMMWQAMNQAI